MAKAKKSTGKKQKTTVRRIIRFIWLVFAGGLLFTVLLFTAISMGRMGFMPSFEELENPKSNLASEIYSADGKLLGKFYYQNRSPWNKRNITSW